MLLLDIDIRIGSILIGIVAEYQAELYNLLIENILLEQFFLSLYTQEKCKATFHFSLDLRI
jgi:hypothetical protein